MPSSLLESLRLVTNKPADSPTDIDCKQEIVADAAVQKVADEDAPKNVIHIKTSKDTPGTVTFKMVEQGKPEMPDLSKVTLSYASSPSVAVTKTETPRMIIPRREFLDLKEDVTKIRNEIVEITQKVQLFSDALLEHSKANGEKMDSILAVLQSMSDGVKVVVDSNLKK